jgi:hypothetical protein
MHSMFDHCLYFNTTALARLVDKEWTLAFKPFGVTPSQGFHAAAGAQAARHAAARDRRRADDLAALPPRACSTACRRWG